MEEGSVVAALAGMAFVMVGLFQFLRGYVASSNQEYKKLRTEMEMVQKENIQLKVNNLHWKNKYLLLEAQSKTKLDDCYETIQTYLDKTNPELRKDEDKSEN